ncbi:hypothetical protein N7509_000626 [Penicillium cosmopolitanum]|uniref:Uncharacterized protein n=1 Tax=Penicillium cosmopolitanum TaxID=1131564 RepID=A0A9W9WBB3_9EURO|nr:uncharacterized protein N7509_000626 [Penicillium cosmopolitanum]KAJ5413999.1 hypothetical protein N7509_000626 [Penicillium cosmopolitanum]
MGDLPDKGVETVGVDMGTIGDEIGTAGDDMGYAGEKFGDDERTGYVDDESDVDVENAGVVGVGICKVRLGASLG